MQLKGAHHARPTANHECLLLVCALLFTACQPTLLSEGDLAPDLSRSAPSQELIEANASLCAQYMQVLWNRGHVDIVEDIIAEEFFSHDPHGDASLDHAGVQAMVEGFRQENPFDYFVIADMVVSEDKVVMRDKHLRMTGDALPGMQPEAATDFVLFLTIEDGKIASRWAMF